MSARIIRVIETDLQVRGDGSPTQPVRAIRQYWSETGELLAELDPLAYGPELARAARALMELLEKDCREGGTARYDGYLTHLRAVLDRRQP